MSADKAVEKKFGNRTMPPVSDRWAEGWARRNGRPIDDMRRCDHGGRDILVDPLSRPEDDAPGLDHAAAPTKRRITPAAVPTEQTLLVVMTSGKRVRTRCALTREQYDSHLATLELDAAQREQEAAVRRTIEAARRHEAARLALKAADRAQRLRSIQSYGVKATEVGQ